MGRVCFKCEVWVIYWKYCGLWGSGTAGSPKPLRGEETRDNFSRGREIPDWQIHPFLLCVHYQSRNTLLDFSVFGHSYQILYALVTRKPMEHVTPSAKRALPDKIQLSRKSWTYSKLWSQLEINSGEDQPSYRHAVYWSVYVSQCQQHSGQVVSAAGCSVTVRHLEQQYNTSRLWPARLRWPGGGWWGQTDRLTRENKERKSE
jgi:hypothetical protein